MLDAHYESNPAHRLVRLLNPVNTDPVKSKTIVDGWPIVMSLPKLRREATLYAIGQISRLPSQTKAAVSIALPDNPQMYLTWVDPVHNALNDFNLSNQFQAIRNQITSERYSLLQICEHQLFLASKCERTDEKHDENLEGIYSDVLDCISDVVNNDVPPDLKTYVLKHLDIIERSIVDFKISGVSRCIVDLESSIGLASVRPDLLDRMKENSVTSSAIEAIGRMVQFASTFQSAEYLIDKAKVAIKFLSECAS